MKETAKEDYICPGCGDLIFKGESCFVYEGLKLDSDYSDITDYCDIINCSPKCKDDFVWHCKNDLPQASYPYGL